MLINKDISPSVLHIPRYQQVSDQINISSTCSVYSIYFSPCFTVHCVFIFLVFSLLGYYLINICSCSATEMKSHYGPNELDWQTKWA